MTSIDTVLHRLNVALGAYIVMCALHQFAHGQIDNVWAQSGQIMFLVMFGMVPMVGMIMLWVVTMRRIGGIVALGSVPAAAFFLLVNRYVDKHACAYPIEFPVVWTTVYDVTYFLLIASALIVAFIAVQFLRAFHAGPSLPLSQ
jgi:hypothetical protein